MDRKYIFVYGLLKSIYKNEPARFIRENCELVSEAWFPGCLFDIGSYPGAVFDADSESKVFGEVFEVMRNEDELVAFLDNFEGVGPKFDQPNEYVRRQIPVQTKTGELAASCYLYNWDTTGKQLIANGRYENPSGKRKE